VSNLTTTIVSEIQRHHREATAAAGVAIKHAIEAGRLLIEAKAAMPHGTFADWVQRECDIGYRTARRYMQAAEKWGALPATEWPSVANLAKALTGETKATPRAPGWLPPLGEATTTTDGRGRFWLVWRVTSEHAAAIAITDTGASGCVVEGMPRGIRNDYLPDVLAMLGLPKPATAEWSPTSVAICHKWRDSLTEVAIAA
jgi:hypothetical protein